jgi:Cd2+/Zn2+-exporting ATPase
VTITYCAQVMLNSLEDVQGVAASHLDMNGDTLTLEYDPAQVPEDKLLVVTGDMEHRLKENYEQCGFRAANMYCDDCLHRFEGHQLAAPPAYPDAYINSANGVLSVMTTPQIGVQRLKKTVKKLDHQIETSTKHGVTISRDRLEPIFVATTLLAFIVGLILRNTTAPAWLPTLAAVIAYTTGGAFALIEGIKGLRELKIDVDLLMLLAAAGAALIGSWPEGAMLLFLFSLSNLLQNYAMDRSRKAIRGLLDLRPAMALVRRGGQEVEVLVEMLEVGETVIIKPGERIPVDGVVKEGESAVDQASITGESLPVTTTKGDQVFAGTVNQHGALEVTVTKRAEDTTLAKIIQMVENAQEQKAPTQRFLDTFEQYYAIFVIAAVSLFIIIPTVFLGVEFQSWFYRGMVLLVVASPCALVISTPASILSAIANAARKGILFKGGAHLENAATLKVVAFDKTGTLTTGKPHITDLIAVNGYHEDELLALSATVESRSEHPLAQAVIQAAEERGLSIAPADDFLAYPGMGVRARVDGSTLLVGSRKLMQQEGYDVDPNMNDEVIRLEREGKTVLLIHNEHCVGAIAVADEPRPEAKDTVTALRAAGVERVAMLTGDNERVAAAIAKEVGVDEFHAGLMPDEKVSLLKDLEKKYGHIAMVGDGVNDAPALATASIGIAMGAAGTDVALETADVVLMADDLTKLPYVLELSKRARRVVWQNIGFSLAVIVALVLGTFGVYGQEIPLPLGVVGHEGSTVLVVFNGLRLLAFKGK